MLEELPDFSEEDDLLEESSEVFEESELLEELEEFSDLPEESSDLPDDEEFSLLEGLLLEDELLSARATDWLANNEMSRQTVEILRVIIRLFF